VKLDFFICGVQKGGTTALDSFLRQHPSIQMSRVKEVHHFDNESLDWSAPDHASLHANFDLSLAGRTLGEATPIYSYWPNSVERLHAYNPNARLILLLRNPVLRAWSHWRMETTRGFETLQFSDAIRPTARERVHSAPNSVHRIFSYVERGFYAAQIARILNLFPAEQLLVVKTQSLWEQPEETLRSVERFIGVEHLLLAPRHYVVPIKPGQRGQLARADADYLLELYTNDIHATQRLTGLKLSDWLTPEASYDEPMMPQ
jgi:Sulfotransferase domain